MPVFLLKPDNFLFPVPMKIVHANSGQELLDRVKASFQIPSHIETYIYTGPRGYTNRSRLDTLDMLPESDPSYAWIVLISPSHPTSALPSTDLSA
jgi:hypothetical protein